MGQLTISMAIFKFANCKRLPGRVKNRDICRSRLTPRSSDPRTRAQFLSLIDTWCSMLAANGQPRTANRSTTKKHPIIPWSLHDVTKGWKSSVMVFFCASCASCAYVHCLTTPTPKHHLTRTALRWPSGILWDPKRLADLLVAKLFCCKQPHLGRRMLLQPFNQWIQWAHLDFRKNH